MGWNRQQQKGYGGGNGSSSNRGGGNNVNVNQLAQVMAKTLKKSNKGGGNSWDNNWDWSGYSQGKGGGKNKGYGKNKGWNNPWDSNAWNGGWGWPDPTGWAQAQAAAAEARFDALSTMMTGLADQSSMGESPGSIEGPQLNPQFEEALTTLAAESQERARAKEEQKAAAAAKEAEDRIVKSVAESLGHRHPPQGAEGLATPPPFFPPPPPMPPSHEKAPPSPLKPVTRKDLDNTMEAFCRAQHRSNKELQQLVTAAAVAAAAATGKGGGTKTSYPPSGPTIASYNQPAPGGWKGIEWCANLPTQNRCHCARCGAAPPAGHPWWECESWDPLPTAPLCFLCGGNHRMVDCKWYNPHAMPWEQDPSTPAAQGAIDKNARLQYPDGLPHDPVGEVRRTAVRNQLTALDYKFQSRKNDHAGMDAFRRKASRRSAPPSITERTESSAETVEILSEDEEEEEEEYVPRAKAPRTTTIRKKPGMRTKYVPPTIKTGSGHAPLAALNAPLPKTVLRKGPDGKYQVIRKLNKATTLWRRTMLPHRQTDRIRKALRINLPYDLTPTDAANVIVGHMRPTITGYATLSRRLESLHVRFHTVNAARRPTARTMWLLQRIVCEKEFDGNHDPNIAGSSGHVEITRDQDLAAAFAALDSDEEVEDAG